MKKQPTSNTQPPTSNWKYGVRVSKLGCSALNVDYWLFPILLLSLGLTFNFNARADAPTDAANNNLTDTNITQDLISVSNHFAANPPPTFKAVTTPAASVASNPTNAIDPKLAQAIYLATSRQPEKAEPLLIDLLAANIPEATQQAALFELASVVRDENNLPRAQSIYAQYLNRWPGTVKVPEILLRQGQIFRQMGLNDLALGKFYSVMTAALSLKGDQLDYYQALVSQTQVEIAETHYLTGQFADAADFYSRLLQNPDPNLNRTQLQFRLVRSLAIIGRNNQAIAQAHDFIAQFPDADQVPEVRYYLAQALKNLGQNTEALQQVLLCLREQKVKTQNQPEVWAYWQQRVGNEIGNQLYHDGDYVNALEVYLNLAQLNAAPRWQIPVNYQMGMTYEKLLQPQKAVEAYNAILARETEVGTNATPGLKSVFGMARWRVNFLQWQTNAEAMDHSLVRSRETTTTNLTSHLSAKRASNHE